MNGVPVPVGERRASSIDQAPYAAPECEVLLEFRHPLFQIRRVKPLRR